MAGAVSPLQFFLPGLLKSDPPAEKPNPGDSPVQQAKSSIELAQAR